MMIGKDVAVSLGTGREIGWRRAGGWPGSSSQARIDPLLEAVVRVEARRLFVVDRLRVL
jgi:hypothetical protein